MRQAGCSKSSITKFNELFGNPDPQSLYAQNILADLQANRYAPKSVKRHITRMHDFREQCYSQLGSHGPISRKLTNLQTLTLANKQLAALPGEIGQLTNLQTLKLANNRLAALPGEIGQLTNLQTLELANNRLAALPGEIGQLTNLQTLELANNRLAVLPGEIGQLTNLQTLELNHNQFAALPDAIVQLTDLQTLKLANNELAALPDAIGRLTNLQTLGLANNKLAALPDAIVQLTDLKTLGLNHNELAALPDAIVQLTNLKTLGLTNNGLAALPGEIGQLTNLQTLELNHNELAALPGEIGQLTKLQTLELANNQFVALPGEIGQLTKLQTLDLDNNRLAALPGEIGQLTNLRMLGLDNNELAALPDAMGRLTNLQILKLANNEFAALPGEIGQMTNLRMLDLDNNELAALPDEIWQLTNLKTLRLNHNELVALPDAIGQLTNLRWLWLQNNQFTTVPRVLLDLPAETEINLQDNPLPDAEIRAVREELDQRRAMGQAVPQLILPPLAAAGEDALRVAAAGGLNVHLQPLTDAFKRRLDELANQFPDNLKGSTEQQRAEIKTIEERLFAAFKRHAAPHLRYRAARDVARTMFQKGYGQRAAHFNDFRYSSGHVLCYVVLAMEAQWARTPATERDQAQENGVNNLIGFLAAGHNFCDTRHIEEVLQMIGIPLSRHAQDNADIIGATPVGLTAEQIREATLPVAKRTLLDLARQSPDLADDALQAAFRTALTHAMHAEHPGVTPEQLNAYLDTDILPMWDTFKELALDEEGNPP